jgi:Ca-activated chloride channel family protein
MGARAGMRSVWVMVLLELSACAGEGPARVRATQAANVSTAEAARAEFPAPAQEEAPAAAKAAAPAASPVQDMLAAEVGATAVGGALGQGMAHRQAERKRSMPVRASSPKQLEMLRAPLPAAPPVEEREAYAQLEENVSSSVKDAPLSTFSVDVDTASYSNVRRFLQDGTLPPKEAVRVEELINYFHYTYPAPLADEPFTTYAEVGACPWNGDAKLVHLGIKARDMEEAAVPPRNLVFLVDVSGSRQSADKLPLLKSGLSMLTERLRPQDRVSIVVYAGASGVALAPTPGSDRASILEALSRLEAGGSTNGGQGIELAYHVAEQHFRKGAINRVILATDGDFNVGVTSEGALVDLIAQKRKTGVYLTVLGFGRGNLQDARMEQLADKGNGNYAYIDSLAEAQKVLVREAGSMLVTVAKDVKLQVEWNPAEVESYRLIGYENRALAARDFNDDKKDAGEIGAGHTVTALYEVVPRKRTSGPQGEVDALRYQADRAPTAAATSGELLTLKVRYKAPESDVSELLTRTLDAREATSATPTSTFRFSAAVAGFGLLLRDSPHVHGLTLGAVRALARGAMERDEHGDRAQFLELVRAAERIRG